MSVTVPNWWNTATLQIASTAVALANLDDSLRDFLTAAAQVHFYLFGKPLIITSGNDGNHVTHSAHYLNWAVDIRSRDLADGEQLLFGMVLCFIAARYKIAVFDERTTPGQHWHVQTAASAGA